jgi:hypothetical protein
MVAEYNPDVPRVVKIASILMDGNNKTVALTNGEGYIAVILDVRLEDGTPVPADTAYNTHNLSFVFNKDATNVVQYNAYDVLYANALLGNVPAGINSGGTTSSNDSILLPLCPSSLAPAVPLEKVCHSTNNIQNFSLNIYKEGATNLLIDVYGVTVTTSKQAGSRYLYVENVTGNMNESITSFSTINNSITYGFIFHLNGTYTTTEKVYMDLRMQGKQIFNDVDVSIVGAYANAVGATYVSQSNPDDGEYTGIIRFNMNKKYSSGMVNTSTDNTNFRFITESGSTLENSTVSISHYQMRDESLS